MKRKILITLIYLTGCFTNYGVMKLYHIHEFPTLGWRNKDRIGAMILAPTSWIGVGIQAIVIVLRELPNQDAQANW